MVKSLLVLLAWGLLALFILDRGELLRFIRSTVEFLSENKIAVFVTVAVAVAVMVIGRKPQLGGR